MVSRRTSSWKPARWVNDRQVVQTHNDTIIITMAHGASPQIRWDYLIEFYSIFCGGTPFHIFLHNNATDRTQLYTNYKPTHHNFLLVLLALVLVVLVESVVGFKWDVYDIQAWGFSFMIRYIISFFWQMLFTICLARFFLLLNRFSEVSNRIY